MAYFSRTFQSFFVASLLVAALVCLGIFLVRESGFLQSVELAVYDLLIRSQSNSVEQESPTVIIAITEKDIRDQGHYPITDFALAEILKKIISYHPRAIGVDIYRDIEVPPGRNELNAVLREYPYIIGVMKVGGMGITGTPPPPVLVGTDQVGFSDIVVDPDGTVRRGLLYQDAVGEVAHSFALRLTQHYLQEEEIRPKPDPIHPDHLRLGPITLTPFKSSDGGYVNADAGGYQILMGFPDGHVPPSTYSLNALLSGSIPPQSLKGKIVLLGVMAESVPDVFHSPFGQSLAGIEVHASLSSQLVWAGLGYYHPVSPASDFQEILFIALWCVLGAGFGLWARSVWGFSFGVLFGLVVLAGIVFVVFWLGWWMPTVPAGLGWVLAASIVTALVLSRERSDRKVLEQLFHRYVSPEVAQTIWEQRKQFLDGGRPRSQKMIVVVLFMDLQGYSSAAEHMEPTHLMNWVNSYLDGMATCIIQHGGVIDDYAGDGIKANFGVPVPRTTESAIQQEARKAVFCALDMVKKFIQLNEFHREHYQPSVGIRIGIATGSVVAGSLGSSQRLKYTTVGDTVNVAARLESLETDRIPLCPKFRYRILLDEASFAYVSQEVTAQEKGEITVKGREQAVKVFQLEYRSEQALNR